jgi:hypothetical protein
MAGSTFQTNPFDLHKLVQGEEDHPAELSNEKRN